MKNSKNVSFIELSDNEAEMISGGGFISFIRRLILPNPIPNPIPNPHPLPGPIPPRPRPIPRF